MGHVARWRTPTKSGGSTSLSLVLATYNGEQFLPELLSSLAGQTRAPDELIIVDDGSSDDTLDMIDDLNVVRIRLDQITSLQIIQCDPFPVLGVRNLAEGVLSQINPNEIVQDDIDESAAIKRTFCVDGWTCFVPCGAPTMPGAPTITHGVISLCRTQYLGISLGGLTVWTCVAATPRSLTPTIFSQSFLCVG